MLFRSRVTIPLLALVFVFLSIAAAVDDGSMLRTWDEPVSRFLMDHRSPGLDGIVKAFSSLGGITVVSLVLVLLLLLVWQECRSLALVLLAASLARPLLEWGLKALIDRPRPDLGRIVPGNGPSFPTGHVMAAIAIWGLLPPVVAVVSGKRAAWWWSVGVSAAVVVVVGFSRVYLGVHWMSDVIGALVLGSLYLLVVEWLLDWHHRRQPCPHLGQGYEALELGAVSRPQRGT
ncbi:MAG TPA: phosphatase PAP2 family protein [Acidimicrobiales bacterium]|nr:phosphatase PAP2 family protein [Acidimicrobiales bacterium]